MSEESMIERVAKVIELAARNSAVTIYGGYKGETLEQFVANTYLDEEDASELFGNAAKDAARAAIEAMREPPESVRYAGYDAASSIAQGGGRVSWDSDIDAAWQAMIDKALP